MNEKVQDISRQLTFGDVTPEYDQFLEKFKPKKTTDDCFTPQNIYNVILSWVRNEYKIPHDVPIIRPFFPGGDYERHKYPVGCVVVDNPPFSILSDILAFYDLNGIRFFLFCPYLTSFSGNKSKHFCNVITGSSITYENGATVDTCFITNMDSYLVRTAADLTELIKKEDEKNRKAQTKQLPKYKYPDEVLTASMVGYMTRHGVDYYLRPEDAHFIRALDAQRASGKGIFGAGFLLSEKAAAEKAAAEKAAAEKAAAEKAAAEKAAAEKAAAEVWELTDQEKAIVKSLGVLG